MADGLKLVVSGDVTQAQQAIKKLTGDVEKSADKIDNSYKKTFSSVSQSIAKVPAATRPAVAAVSRLGDTIETLRAKLLAKQSFLVTETDIRKIAVLNTEIAQLQGEITRVSNAGKAGFDNLGNSVQKASGQFSGLAAGAQKGFSALRVLANILPGIGIAGLIGLLSEAVIGLFKTADGFDAATISAAKFSQALKEAKSDLEGVFKGESDLAKLQNQIDLGEGTKLITANFQVDKTANDKIIQVASEEISRIVDRIGQLRNNAAFTLSKQGREVLNLFPVDADIPDNFIDELDESDKKIIREIKLLGTRAESLDKERFKAAVENKKLVVQNQIDLNEEVKKQQDKSLDDLKKYIDKAKQLNSELEKAGFVAPASFSFFDTQAEQLKKAQKVFNDFNNNRVKLDTNKLNAAFPIQITEPPPERVAAALSATEELVKSGMIDFPPIEIPVEFNAVEANNAAIISDFRKKFEALGATLKLPAGALQDPALFNVLNAQFEKLKQNIDFATASANILSNAFSNVISKISQGESPIQAFFQAIGQSILQLITQLIAAAIRAAIFKAILGGATGGASQFLNRIPGGGVFGFAAGGIVSGPTLALVGEGLGTSRSNPEVIAPLDQLKAMLSDLGGGSPQVVLINSRVRGNNLDLVLNRQQRQNRRLGAG